MEFTLPPEVETTRSAIRRFVDKRLIPLESDPASYDAHENIDEALLDRLRGEARAQGLWAVSMPVARGGRGFDRVGMAACYEEMNRSIFGPLVLNAAAPDDGNMFVLNALASEAQKDRWLQPIIDGRVRSSIVMTEPAPGAGSDPAGMMLTRAERSGDKWVVSGRKWFITGAEGAQHFILAARTSDEPRRELTTFLFHADQPGWRIMRRIPIMGPEEHGGHCEIELDGLEIPDENRLGEVGHGMRVVQTRLGTARLTHCMRWLGLGRRSLEIAGEYVATRQAFGKPLAERESVQMAMGQAAMALQIGRLLTMRAAWVLDQGDNASAEVSAAKIHVADALHKAVDTAIQLCVYRYARQARLVDGASEVHQMVINRMLAKQGQEFWRWKV
jgi:acyl-CoA dehydrogenase